MIRYKKNTDNIVTLTLDMADRHTNVINHEISQNFVPVIKHLQQEKARGALRGVIITSAKKTFMMGEDIDYLYETNDIAQIFEFAQTLSKFCRDLESPGVPVVAAVNGAALGSGFELAMSCHHRIVLDKPNIEVGYPEVNIGLMPNGGGTIRLLWLLGIEKAYQVLTSGKKYSPKEALAAGIIDAIAVDEEDMMTQAEQFLLETKEGRRPWDQPDEKIPGGTALETKVARTVRLLAAQLCKQNYNNYDAPQAILNTLTEASKVDFDTACTIESRHFAHLVSSKQSKNMMKAFWYDANKVMNGFSRPKGYGKFRPKKVGVIGAGMMGSGIAYSCLSNGLSVVLKDVSKPIAEIGKRYTIQKLSEKTASSAITKAESQVIFDKLKATDSSKDFRDCDLVIEAVFENEMVKSKVIKEAEEFLDQYSILASNTLSIPISRLSSASERPDNFVGIHFFPPADEVPLVEIVKGKNTSDETVARAYDFAISIGKIPIIVKDKPGFFVARVLNTYVLEGIAMLQEGYSPALIENLGLQAGMPKSPFVLADELSFKIVLEYEQQAAVHYGTKYMRHAAVDTLYDLMDNLDRYGKQKKAGFYNYDENGNRKNLWEGLTENFPTTKQDYIREDLTERLLFAMVAEATWRMQEKVVQTVAEANLGSIYGLGFPAYKGGVIQYINDYGIQKFVARCADFEQKHGQRFMLPKFIREAAENNSLLV